MAGKLEEAITAQKPKTPTGIEGMVRGQMESLMTELLPQILGDKIDEIVKDKVEEEVTSLLKVLRGPKGDKGEDAKNPIKGLDYLTPKELEQIRTELTPIKGVHYSDGKDGKSLRGFPGRDGRDGVDGKPGMPGKDGTLVKGEEIISKINVLPEKPEFQIDAKHIKNLPKGGVMRGGGSSVKFETPTGTINGSNTTFTLATLPRSGGLLLFVNGLLQTVGEDYSVSSKTITMNTAPPTNSIVKAFIIK